tara:strand:+ start:728 stop:1009 length:282 start_codon:yes stop_codon:yes gene_type:complete
MAKGGLHKLSVQEAQNAALGQAGSTFIDDTAQHTGHFVAITAIEDSVVDVSDCTNIADTMTDAADFTIPAGLTIYGRFEVFSLASGKVIAYKG